MATGHNVGASAKKETKRGIVRARESPDIFVLASRLGFFLKSEESLKY